MLRSNIFKGGLLWPLVLISGLGILFGLVLPLMALAAPPTPTGAEQCDGCHSEETAAWQNSPHANASSNEEGIIGATCEACHGSYVKGHAQTGVMQLTVDSSGCKECHTNTFGQWESSTHARAGVQCIGCHLSHSQTLRLTDEALCDSCHRDWLEDFFHTAHNRTDITCTSCHLSSTSYEMMALADSGEISRISLAPSHDFVTVSSENCVNCHKQAIYAETTNTELNQVTGGQLLAKVNLVPDLTDKLNISQQTIKSLKTMTFVSLGLGLGVGGMMGIILVLVVGYIDQRRSKK